MLPRQQHCHAYLARDSIISCPVVVWLPEAAPSTALRDAEPVDPLPMCAVQPVKGSCVSHLSICSQCGRSQGVCAHLVAHSSVDHSPRLGVRPHPKDLLLCQLVLLPGLLAVALAELRQALQGGHQHLPAAAGQHRLSQR